MTVTVVHDGKAMCQWFDGCRLSEGVFIVSSIEAAPEADFAVGQLDIGEPAWEWTNEG